MMKTKIAIVVSDFNEEITSLMEKTAEALTTKLNSEIIEKIHVPGAFEIPFAVKNIFEKKEADAIVTLGAVIQGRTDHDLVIVNTIASKLIDLSLQYNKPIGFGILGPRVTREQAKERAEKYAERAVKTALEMIKTNK